MKQVHEFEQSQTEPAVPSNEQVKEELAGSVIDEHTLLEQMIGTLLIQYL